MAKFNFNHTCPLIDNGIKQIKNSIENVIEEINEPMLQYMNENQKKDLVDGLYTQWFEDEIEQLRATNSDMRSEAEYQINKIADDYETKVEELKNEVEELKNIIEELSEE